MPASLVHKRRPPPAHWRAAVLRATVWAHRWLGVGLGLVMLVWCLSGFVMMYVDYPRLTAEERRLGLAPLDLSQPLADLSASLPAETPLAGFRLEMLGDRPVLRLQPVGGRGPRPGEQMRATPLLLDAVTGQSVAALTAEQVVTLANDAARRSGIAGRAEAAELIEADQWTVQNARRHQPLYKVPFNDAAGSVLYVAGASGERVQQTTRWERFWGWLGAVPHWLYPTLLRQQPVLWTQVVIWLSLAGCFLTLAGIIIGLVRLRRRDGSLSIPYRGLWRWHHVSGLVAGLLTLSWVASGLLSMNPWGLLDSEAGGQWRGRLAGTLTGVDAAHALALAPGLALPPDTVMLEAVPLGGRLHLTAVTRDGLIQRFDAGGRPAPLTEADISDAITTSSTRIAELTLLSEPDDYYYAHKGIVTLPVWRAILADAEATRLYIDAGSGALLRAFDAPARQFRWWQDGLHRLDFAWMRARPLWDLLVIPALAAVSLLCATGSWMGLRRLGLKRRRRRKPGGIQRTTILSNPP
ncbi:PepSY domain-containing protein [Niveispirillum sp. BGYR6]|uniref:PepSY domain-containing protein n=1 Tax=Niveispirillum sp. BGYR6 TaxID=2971249 RepID=UPI0022B9CF0B|nr:PepSY domain-containing protein [Niveispirillum sp. BGYR6]MDG5494773.1 PepSY domain-containing protein [Niveispirillum sp. BGYR6]